MLCFFVPGRRSRTPSSRLTFAAMVPIKGVKPMKREPSDAEYAVHTCVSKMLLSSEALFRLAEGHYKKSGRGACVVLFDSVQEVNHATKPVVFKYYDLCDLLHLRYPPVCELARVYNVSHCFVLLVQVYVHPNVTSAAVIAHREHGDLVSEKNEKGYVMGQLDCRLVVPRALAHVKEEHAQ